MYDVRRCCGVAWLGSLHHHGRCLRTATRWAPRASALLCTQSVQLSAARSTQAAGESSAVLPVLRQQPPGHVSRQRAHPLQGKLLNSSRRRGIGGGQKHVRRAALAKLSPYCDLVAIQIYARRRREQLAYRREYARKTASCAACKEQIHVHQGVARAYERVLSFSASSAGTRRTVLHRPSAA